jgi:hypothetical protein
MVDPRFAKTLTGETFLILNPVAIAELMRSPAGPVMRDMIVRGERVKQAAIRIAPVRTGNLRDHIVKRIVQTPQGGGVLVGVEHVPYAIWVHEGAKPHIIVPRNAKMLAWPSEGGGGGGSFDMQHFGPGSMIFAHIVHHPGNKPNRFLIRALRAAA